MDNIHQQVQEHKERRQNQDDALQHGDIPLKDRQVEQETRPWPAKHSLDEDRATQQIAKLQAHQGQHWRGGILHDVPRHRPRP